MILLSPTLAFSQKNSNKKKVKASSGLTAMEIELAKFRKENPIYFQNHIEGSSESSGKTSINYSKFNGKNCSEIAKKENWGKWNPPDNADEKCRKFLASKRKTIKIK